MNKIRGLFRVPHGKLANERTEASLPGPATSGEGAEAEEFNRFLDESLRIDREAIDLAFNSARSAAQEVWPSWAADEARFNAVCESAKNRIESSTRTAIGRLEEGWSSWLDVIPLILFISSAMFVLWRTTALPLIPWWAFILIPLAAAAGLLQRRILHRGEGSLGGLLPGSFSLWAVVCGTCLAAAVTAAALIGQSQVGSPWEWVLTSFLLLLCTVPALIGDGLADLWAIERIARAQIRDCPDAVLLVALSRICRGIRSDESGPSGPHSDHSQTNLHPDENVTSTAKTFTEIEPPGNEAVNPEQGAFEEDVRSSAQPDSYVPAPANDILREARDLYVELDATLSDPATVSLLLTTARSVVPAAVRAASGPPDPASADGAIRKIRTGRLSDFLRDSAWALKARLDEPIMAEEAMYALRGAPVALALRRWDFFSPKERAYSWPQAPPALRSGWLRIRDALPGLLQMALATVLFTKSDGDLAVRLLAAAPWLAAALASLGLMRAREAEVLKEVLKG